MAAHPPEFRPYRVTLYALFFSFTVLFIALIIRSVWLDLYGKGPSGALKSEQPPVSTCVDEMEALYRRLAARQGMALTAASEKDWDSFSREFEDRLAVLQSRCVDVNRAGDSAEMHAAIVDSAEKLDALRQHLARCGEEGERESATVSAALTELRRRSMKAPDAQDDFRRRTP